MCIRDRLEKQEVSALPQSEQKILNLVGMRLLCATGEKHTYAETQISLSCEGYAFKAKGKTCLLYTSSIRWTSTRTTPKRKTR